jgi:predicted GNAT family acetyltransferase
MATDEVSVVRDNPEQNRFELETDAGLAVADYSRDGDLLIIFHTEVPVAIHGQGIGDRLVRGALKEIQRRKLKVIPRCWFVRRVMESDPLYRDLLA